MINFNSPIFNPKGNEVNVFFKNGNKIGAKRIKFSNFSCYDLPPDKIEACLNADKEIYESIKPDFTKPHFWQHNILNHPNTRNPSDAIDKLRSSFK